MIEIRDLTVQYPGATTLAIDTISLDITDGEFVAVMGANGSGKSTLARTLNGLIQPTSGSVTVDGWSTSDEESCRSIRRHLGMVFQNPHLQITSPTVEREVAFGLQNIGVASRDIRARVDVQLAISELSSLRTRPPRTLSAGEQQRLALASVSAMQPRHLVLDEATSLLSPRSRNELLLAVSKERASRGMTVLLITQFPEEAMRAERLIILHAGEVLMDGKPEQVFRQYAEMRGLDVPVPTRLRPEAER